MCITNDNNRGLNSQDRNMSHDVLYAHTVAPRLEALNYTSQVEVLQVFHHRLTPTCLSMLLQAAHGHKGTCGSHLRLNWKT